MMLNFHVNVPVVKGHRKYFHFCIGSFLLFLTIRGTVGGAYII